MSCSNFARSIPVAPWPGGEPGKSHQSGVFASASRGSLGIVAQNVASSSSLGGRGASNRGCLTEGATSADSTIRSPLNGAATGSSSSATPAVASSNSLRRRAEVAAAVAGEYAEVADASNVARGREEKLRSHLAWLRAERECERHRLEKATSEFAESRLREKQLHERTGKQKRSLDIQRKRFAEMETKVKSISETLSFYDRAGQSSSSFFSSGRAASKHSGILLGSTTTKSSRGSGGMVSAQSTLREPLQTNSSPASQRPLQAIPSRALEEPQDDSPVTRKLVRCNTAPSVLLSASGGDDFALECTPQEVEEPLIPPSPKQQHEA